MRRAATLTLLVGVVGCGSNDLDDADHVRTWANTGSAVGVYAHAYEPIAFADGEATFKDPACPKTSDDGTTVTITGGCTDSEGKEWSGVATIVRSGGDKKLTLKEYGSYDPDQRSVKTGTVDIRRKATALHEFDVDLEIRGGMTTTISYAGTVAGDYHSATTWDGGGRVEREGLVAPTGSVDATTAAQVLDDTLCKGQAASGKTTIVSNDATVVVTYDGAVDCDADKAARWSVDGEDRGTIDGITCSADAVGSARHTGPSAVLLLWVGLGLMLAARRRR